MDTATAIVMRPAIARTGELIRVRFAVVVTHRFTTLAVVLGAVIGARKSPRANV